jgi:hypothetical protein
MSSKANPEPAIWAMWPASIRDVRAACSGARILIRVDDEGEHITVVRQSLAEPTTDARPISRMRGHVAPDRR